MPPTPLGPAQRSIAFPTMSHSTVGPSPTKPPKSGPAVYTFRPERPPAVHTNGPEAYTVGGQPCRKAYTLGVLFAVYTCRPAK